jgi:cytochrome c oxidase subunit 2
VNHFLRRLLFLPPQASSFAREIDTLHYFVIITTMAGATLVTVVGAYLVFRYRVRDRTLPPKRSMPAPRPSHWMEGGLIVGLFGLFIAWWAIGFAQYVRVRVAPEGTLDIYVTAKQWMWTFGYPDGQHAISTVYVPAGRPVKLIMTSRDVIHSFYVPDFRVKQDVVPGRYTTVWFSVNEPGTHQILCAEMCGTGHSLMRGEVVALAPADYARWLAAGPPEALAGPVDDQPATVDRFTPREPLSLVRAGMRAAAERGCLRCHTLDGTPHIGPTWAGLYGSLIPLVGGATVIGDEAYLTESMMDPLAKVHLGFPPVMPTYQGLLASPDASAIVELIKSLRELRTATSPPGTAPPPPAGPLPVAPVPTPPVQP